MMLTNYLKKGKELANNGDWQQAKQIFCKAIQIMPDSAEAHYYLGIASKELQDWEKSIEYLSLAIALAPNYSEAHFMLGIIFSDCRQWKEAAASYYNTIKLKPDWAEAYFRLGIVLISLNRPEGAESCFRTVIGLKPDYSDAYNSLGILYSRRNMLSKALQSFSRCVDLNPDQPIAHNNLGLTLQKLKRYREAEMSFKKAIELNPQYAKAFNNLGLIYEQLDRLPQAVDMLQHAIKIQPDFLLAYHNLTVILVKINRFAEAENYLRQAIDLKPDFYETYRRLGVVLKKMRRLKEAELAYQKALELADSDQAVSVRHVLGVLYLLCGQFAKGWPHYEYRRIVYEQHIYAPPTPQISNVPYWQGESLSGKSLILFFEQGLGDTIQFIRYLPQLSKAARKVTVIVQSGLQQLLSYSLNNNMYNENNLPSEPYDFACSVHSLPALFKTSAETIPNLPYITVENTFAAKWQNTLGKMIGGRRFRVGVVWAGDPYHENDCNRSIPFATFRQLFNVEKTDWVSLQVGKRAGDLPLLPNVTNLSPRLTDFHETAGAIKNLDLVISVDSAVAHLAGAMGKRTWTLLPFDCDWRWQLDREDSPWYPSLRLFRQQKPGNWQDVLDRVQNSLRNI
ncbi:tetratricopeptide (TPR) repeat protein [Sporomusaceae bacterium BoRhaA]|uniref:tetratricopeptide repeat protein n=1 Tax=Pelorhabdus rhamnosifermentans TaxID=2772457 RepID=UPI001C063746|nr:tetratricopeptide repeat protein [Pelorhabdus rhamnosifermentans]MBU2699889.1 tetratricopeptide (TPR) repeat protein [Pelorhabdus rhamnosifermentans]